MFLLSLSFSALHLSSASLTAAIYTFDQLTSRPFAEPVGLIFSPSLNQAFFRAYRKLDQMLQGLFRPSISYHQYSKSRGMCLLDEKQGRSFGGSWP